MKRRNLGYQRFLMMSIPILCFQNIIKASKQLRTTHLDTLLINLWAWNPQKPMLATLWSDTIWQLWKLILSLWKRSFPASIEAHFEWATDLINTYQTSFQQCTICFRKWRMKELMWLFEWIEQTCHFPHEAWRLTWLSTTVRQTRAFTEWIRMNKKKK